MSCKTVKTQAELDTALADDDVTCVHVESDKGVWLRIGDTTKRAELYGNASAELYGNASARLYGNASARLSGNASARLSGNASAELYGNASAELYGNASARLYDNASADAAATSSVHANGRSKVTAGPHVAVHLHSAQATVTGGVVVDVSRLDLADPQVWCEHHGVTVTSDGKAVLYKALGDDLVGGGGYRTPVTYTVGETVTCGDWRPDNGCGGGLHLSPTPHQAGHYNLDATRYLEVHVEVATLRPIIGGTPKCKVPAGLVVREVDVSARPLPEPVPAAT